MIKLTLIVVGLIALGAGSGVGANTQQENLDFINMVISFLNNREKCTLPAYSEIDEVSRRFNELKQQWGLNDNDFQKSLSADQVLLRETVLGQWDSFQKYLTSKNVIPRSKARSYLGKVERYQVQKFGESICIKNPDTQVLDDAEFEKNPLVRYIKQFGEAGKDSLLGRETGVSTGGTPASENFDNDVELKFKVHSRDESGNIQKTKNYVTNFNFDKSRPQNRITLEFGNYGSTD